MDKKIIKFKFGGHSELMHIRHAANFGDTILICNQWQSLTAEVHPPPCKITCQSSLNCQNQFAVKYVCDKVCMGYFPGLFIFKKCPTANSKYNQIFFKSILPLG